MIEQPNIPLIEEFMRSEKTDVILATGGTAMVRSAYSSSNPAIGVGPGNAPVLVDATADLKAAAQFISDSKSFDNSVLCTYESVLITVSEAEKELSRELEKAGCHVCSPEETASSATTCFTSAASTSRPSVAMRRGSPSRQVSRLHRRLACW